MCQLVLWWRSCMAWGSIWGKTGWSRCQIKNHIFKGHLGVGVGACVGLTVFGCVCMCLLCVCVFARCLGSTRRLQTRSWPIPSGYILIYKDDFKVLTLRCWPRISIFTTTLFENLVQTARWLLSISASHSRPRHFRLLRQSQPFENSFQNISATRVEHQSWAKHYIKLKSIRSYSDF